MKGNNRSSLVSITRQASLQWPGLKIDDAWLPPQEAVGVAQPNQWVIYCGVALPDATLPGSKLSESAIRTVCDYIEEHLCTQLTLEALAALLQLSPFHSLGAQPSIVMRIMCENVLVECYAADDPAQALVRDWGRT
jgi:hypothetical protein